MFCGSEDGRLRVWELQTSTLLVDDAATGSAAAQDESVLVALDVTLVVRGGSGVGILAVAGIVDESTISLFRVVDVRAKAKPGPVDTV